LKGEGESDFSTLFHEVPQMMSSLISSKYQQKIKVLYFNKKNEILFPFVLFCFVCWNVYWNVFVNLQTNASFAQTFTERRAKCIEELNQQQLAYMVSNSQIQIKTKS
jgi:hypothetical protein